MKDALRDVIADALRKRSIRGRSPEEIADIALDALRPHDAVKGMVPVIAYFGSEADRDEFIAAVQEVKPDMRAVKL